MDDAGAGLTRRDRNGIALTVENETWRKLFGGTPHSHARRPAKEDVTSAVVRLRPQGIESRPVVLGTLDQRHTPLIANDLQSNYAISGKWSWSNR